LRIHHESALHEGKETFTFEGHQYVTGFTKYLLEYLDMELD
jgi:hypothetical protein